MAALATAALLLASAAYGQTTPPDIVRTKNGGLIRGTIVELVPNDSVTVQLPSGETRKIPMADTVYAGAADKDPAAGRPPAAATERPSETESPAQASPARRTKPYATVHADDAHVELRTTEDGLTFHLKTIQLSGSSTSPYVGSIEAEGYSRLCTAPCSIDVPTGYQRFGLSRPDNRKIAPGEQDVDVRDGAAVRGTYVDHSWMRVLGWVLAIGGPAAGVGMMVGSVFVGEHLVCLATPPGSASPSDCHTESTPKLGLILGGVLVAAVSIPIGVVLITQKDSAMFEIESGTAVAPLPAWATRRSEATSAGAVPGLTATLHL
jgi:hypothetical protein